jgi:signal peptidase II
MSPSSKQPLVSTWGLYAYVLAAMVLILDQLSKWWILNVLHLDLKGQIAVLPVFRLTMVMNPGVSFGLMRADTALGRGFLVGAALIVVIALIAWVRRADRPLFATAIGLVIGGALGNNLIDRARLGEVVDFLDFSGLHFPWVFNVADSAISIGVVLLLWDSFFPGKTAVDKTA